MTFVPVPAAPGPLDSTEEEYETAEREGMRLDSILCADCPDPGTCAAESECMRVMADGLTVWDGLDVVA